MTLLHAPTPTETATLSVRDLTVCFPGGVRALRGVSIDLAPGDILGLVGESGSGKSALCLAALGLLPPEAHVEGSVVLGDTEMVRASPEERRLARRRFAGAVFQDPMTSLNPTMTVGRQVAEVAGSIDAARQALERVHIPDVGRRLGQYPHELSGGLRQRVMIAMAIARNPALLVADEPTTALDVTVQAAILDLFAEVRDTTGCAVVFVTHDLAVAGRVADRIGVMYAGRLVEVGPAAHVLRTPSHPYTAALLAARLHPRSDRRAELPTIPGERPDVRVDTSGCTFAPRCHAAAPPCTVSRPTLEPAPSHEGAVACLRAGEAVPPRGTPRPRARRPAPQEGAAPALVLEGVVKTFGRRAMKRRVLDGISLTVPAGGAVALVGESGCGKTTTLRIAVGLERPDAGTVRVAPGPRPQMVFQDAGASLTPWCTVGQLLGERLRAAGVARHEQPARIHQALEVVGLGPEVLGRRPHQLSGGQRQRVALARAVVVPPPLLVCDEPISALDVSLAATVLNLLGRLRATFGMALLFVTHDLAAARYVADRVAVMHAGRIVEERAAEEVFERPGHEHTHALVAAVPTVEGW